MINGNKGGNMINMNRFDSEIPIIDTEHFFDAIRVNFYFIEKKFLKSLLDGIATTEVIKNNCRYYSFKSTLAKPPKRKDHLETLRKCGIKAQMTIVCPNRLLLDYLMELDILLQKAKDNYRIPPKARYVISYIEIAKDFIVENIHDAKDLSVALYRDTNMHRMNLQDGTVYEIIKGGRVNKSNFKYNIDIKKSIPGAATYTTGGKALYHTGYARISKLSSRPSCHGEFKIIGSPNIKQKTGIESFKDLFSFDIGKFYNKIANKYFYQCEINNLYLGKWFMGYDNKTKLTQEQEQECILQANLWRHQHKIGNYSDLIDRILATNKKRGTRKIKKRYARAKKRLLNFRTTLPVTRIQRKSNIGFVPDN